MSKSEKTYRTHKTSRRKIKSLSNPKRQSSRKNKNRSNKHKRSSKQHKNKQSGGMPYGVKDFSSSTKISPMPKPPCTIL
jgi:hypothetical protein